MVLMEKIAVKEIHISNSEQKNQYMLDMVKREFQIVQRLKYHVVQVIDCIIEPYTCWIFMEFCKLGDLSEYLENNKAIDLMSKVKIIHQSASAVAFMHRQDPSIIHRDLKLQNMFPSFTRRGTCS